MSNWKPTPPPFPPVRRKRDLRLGPLLFLLALIGIVVAVWKYSEDVSNAIRRGGKELGELLPEKKKRAAKKRIGANAQNVPKQEMDADAVAQNAVRLSLKASDPDAEFDEVRWWPVQPLQGSRICDRWKYELATLPDSVIGQEDAWHEITRDGSSIRLKYVKRTFKDTLQMDVVFVIDPQGRAREVTRSNNFRLPGESCESLRKRLARDR